VGYGVHASTIRRISKTEQTTRRIIS
jgi:hypothetical protein